MEPTEQRACGLGRPGKPPLHLELYRRGALPMRALQEADRLYVGRVRSSAVAISRASSSESSMSTTRTPSAVTA